MRELLHDVADRIADYREGLPDGAVFPSAAYDDLVAGFDKPLGDGPTAAAQVVVELAGAAAPGLVATAGPRYLGFVIGGSVDDAVAADLLVTGWDQCAFNATVSPAAAVVEHVTAAWLRELLRAAGHTRDVGGLRHRRPGRQHGRARCRAQPRPVRRRLGCRARRAPRQPSDKRGRVCLQAGNVNTGACDDLRSAYVFCAHPDADRASMSFTAAYLTGQGDESVRNAADWVPESSRRACGFATYAARCARSPVRRPAGRGGFRHRERRRAEPGARARRG